MTGRVIIGLMSRFTKICDAKFVMQSSSDAKVCDVKFASSRPTQEAVLSEFSEFEFGKLRYSAHKPDWRVFGECLANIVCSHHLPASAVKMCANIVRF